MCNKGKSAKGMMPLDYVHLMTWIGGYAREVFRGSCRNASITNFHTMSRWLATSHARRIRGREWTHNVSILEYDFFLIRGKYKRGLILSSNVQKEFP